MSDDELNQNEERDSLSSFFFALQLTNDLAGGTLKLGTDRPSVCSHNPLKGAMMTLKDKIIDAAYELFGEKGYEKTSVAEVIELAGASKGGFYHHFRSKEEILETITFNYIATIKRLYQDILMDERIGVVEKFTASFYRLNEMKIEAVKDWNKIKNLYTFEGNHILLRRMGEAFERETANYYFQLILDGIQEGVFEVAYPKELAALWGREVIRFQQLSRKALMEADGDEEEFYRMLWFDEGLINQQLGLTEKTIELESMGKDYMNNMKQEMKGKVF